MSDETKQEIRDDINELAGIGQQCDAPERFTNEELRELADELEDDEDDGKEELEELTTDMDVEALPDNENGDYLLHPGSDDVGSRNLERVARSDDYEMRYLIWRDGYTRDGLPAIQVNEVDPDE